MANTVNQIKDVLNLVAAGAALAANLGVDEQMVSNAIAQARSQGHGLTDAQLQQIVAEAHKEDAAENAAYQTKMKG